ncbi:MAG: hypothetical protein MR419_00455 [Clostridiales bacterium]|nr:hypothetical protein [Clostridiales bacterium]MDY4173388.1 hypothetical protein [Evtepia sp.]
MMLEIVPMTLREAEWKCVGQAGGLRWTGKRRPKVDLYPAQMKIRYEMSAADAVGRPVVKEMGGNQ